MKQLLFYILLITSVLSCSKYQKVLKSDDVNFKYSQAVKYYKNAEFNKALPIFNELIPIFKGTNKEIDRATGFAGLAGLGWFGLAAGLCLSQDDRSV